MIARARAAAFEILLRVSTTDAHSDELLRSREIDALSAQDRALATTLVLGTLRWQLNLDQAIRALLTRPDGKLAPAVQTALRLGTFQLLYLDRIPAHAAIGESVELAKQAGENYAAGMVNAVLRKLAREPHMAAQNDAEAAHPAWMVNRWRSLYGADVAREICSFDQEPASICVRLVHPDAERALIDEGIELAAGEFLTSARYVIHGDVVRSTAFRRGMVRIQDEGSQVVAELAGYGKNILDVCAAPGGKTAILAERNPTAAILAMDASKRRLDLMRRNFSGDEHIRFAVENAAAMKLSPEYDLILCDVPCTGTGTIGRNPEIRFRVNAEEIARQQVRQVNILQSALEGLAPGGRLVYSTCSLEQEENESVISECVKAGSEFVVQPLDDQIAQLEREGMLHPHGADELRRTALHNGFLRTLPGVQRCDGFFGALIVRS